jgi:signal transduction histidine kinase
MHCLELLNHQLDLNEIDTVLNLDSSLPQLSIDAGQIQQAFMNLLLNAAEAMTNGGILTVTSAVVDGGESVSVTVGDTGPGIPDEIMDKLFDPFFTTKEVGKGTGLGLPVAYGIVHNHGGSMKVRSKVGEGTEFEIRLPVSSPVDDDTEIENPDAEEP